MRTWMRLSAASISSRLSHAPSASGRAASWLLATFSLTSTYATLTLTLKP